MRFRPTRLPQTIHQRGAHESNRSCQIPVLRLARLVVDERVKGQGIGSALLRSVLVLAQQMAEDVGCVGVLVDAKSDAIAFYEKLGFLRLEAEAGELEDRPPPCVMFLDLAQVPRPT